MKNFLYFLSIEDEINRFHFQWSLEETEKATIDSRNISMQKRATVPYLLRLASLSPVLLKAISGDTLQSC